MRAIYSSAFRNFPSRERLTPFTRPPRSAHRSPNDTSCNPWHSAAPSPHTKGHRRRPFILVFSRRISGISAAFEDHMEDLGFTRIWCGHELPVNTSPFDFEVLRGLARIFNDERSLSGLELRWHVDSIVGHCHVHSACVAIRGDGVLHCISGLLHAMSNRPSGLFCSSHGRMHNVFSRVNLRDRGGNHTSEDHRKKCFHCTLRIDP